jgi:hypothetical protein
MIAARNAAAMLTKVSKDSLNLRIHPYTSDQWTSPAIELQATSARLRKLQISTKVR